MGVLHTGCRAPQFRSPLTSPPCPRSSPSWERSEGGWWACSILVVAHRNSGPLPASPRWGEEMREYSRWGEEMREYSRWGEGARVYSRPQRGRVRVGVCLQPSGGVAIGVLHTGCRAPQSRPPSRPPPAGYALPTCHAALGRTASASRGAGFQPVWKHSSPPSSGAGRDRWCAG
jgi:hypothetical protein